MVSHQFDLSHYFEQANAFRILLKAIPSVLADIADMGASSNWPEFWSFKPHIFPNFSTLLSWMVPLTMGIKETGIQGLTERG